MFYCVHLVSGPKGKSAPWCACDKRHRSSTAKSPSRLRCVRQSLQTANACRRYGLLWVRLGSRVTQSRLPLFPQQQTFLSPAVTSEKCQLLTHATQQTPCTGCRCAPGPPAVLSRSRLRALFAFDPLSRHSLTCSRLRVSLDYLIKRPFHRVLGRHALDRLRIHVRDDVFGYHFGGLAIGRPRISWQPAEWRDIAEWQQDRIDFPYLVFLPIPGSAVGVPLLRGEPFRKNRLRVYPAQEILGRFLVLGVTHQDIGEGTWKVKLAAGTVRDARVQDVLPHRRALLGLIRFGFALGFNVDRGAVVGGADGTRQEGAVVIGVVPGESTLVAGVFPKTNRELDRFDGFPAVQNDRLPVGLDLLPAPRPQIRVPPARRIAERVCSGLADGAALGLEFLAGVEQRVPGFWEGIVPNLFEPRLAVSDQRASDGPRHADPFVADGGDMLGDVVVAALGLADLLGHITGIGEAFGVELRPVSERHGDVGSRSRLDRRCDARLQIIGVDSFNHERDAGRLLAFLRDLAFEQHVRSWHEIRPAQPMNIRPLRVGRCAPGG